MHLITPKWDPIGFDNHSHMAWVSGHLLRRPGLSSRRLIGLRHHGLRGARERRHLRGGGGVGARGLLTRLRRGDVTLNFGLWTLIIVAFRLGLRLSKLNMAPSTTKTQTQRQTDTLLGILPCWAIGKHRYNLCPSPF